MDFMKLGVVYPHANYNWYKLGMGDTHYSERICERFVCCNAGCSVLL